MTRALLVELPSRLTHLPQALWHWRCPDVPEFAGELPPLLARSVTIHWFEPCELLSPDARSELKEEFRARQEGGGWEMPKSPRCGTRS